MTSDDLWTAYRAAPVRGGEVEDALARRYLPLVRVVMDRKHLPPSVDREELAAYLYEQRLLRSIREFDPGIAKFETFLTRQLEFGIAEYLRSTDTLTRGQRSKVKLVQAYVSDHIQAHRGEPTTTEIATATGLSVDEVRESFARYAHTVTTSLDALDHPENLGVDQSDLTSSSGLPDDDHSSLREAMRRLRDRDRRILLLYYAENLTSGQIAEIYNISEARISQVRGRAIGLIKTHMLQALREDA